MLDSTFLRVCEDAAERFAVPALAVGVASADGTVELHSIGCELDARFRIASVTKPMTASLVARTVDLDAATGVWPDDVRVRHLLAHTSGFDCEVRDVSAFGDGDDALAALVGELPTVRRFAPTERVWSYSNAGYWLAGWLAAQVDGGTYEDALRRHVLAPAGMASADFGEPDLPGTGQGSGADPYPRARRPSGGVVTDVTDVVRFGRWQLSEAWTAALRRPVGKPVSGVYGLGFYGERVGSVEVWGHSGSHSGFQSSLLLAPDRGAVFAGLTNSGSGGRALALVEDEWLERTVGSRRGRRDSVELAPEALAAFAGTYANSDLTAAISLGEPGLLAELTADGDAFSVAARPIGERRFEIVGGPLDGNRFDFPLEGFARVGSRLLPRVE